MATFYELSIQSIEKITPSAVAVSFEIPTHLKNAFSFTAGQYITIKHTLNGKEVRRAYSICTSPNEQMFTVGIKKVDNGTFSVFANEQLQVGDTLEVMEPEGNFVAAPEASSNYMAFAAGSGITPILAIIKTTLAHNTASKFVLVFGNQSKEEAMFLSEIEKLKATYPDRFFVEYLYSRKPEANARFGRIEKSTVNFFLKNTYAEISFNEYYLCGPEVMIDEVSATLKQHGVNEKLIHFELFTTADEGALVEDHDGTTQVTLTVDDETETFVMPQTTSILEAALENDLDPPYSCQGGICSSCIARVTEGKAEMRKNQILTDSEIAEGFVLTCQAHPTTPTITVDYDDV